MPPGGGFWSVSLVGHKPNYFSKSAIFISNFFLTKTPRFAGYRLSENLISLALVDNWAATRLSPAAQLTGAAGK